MLLLTFNVYAQSNISHSLKKEIENEVDEMINDVDLYPFITTLDIPLICYKDSLSTSTTTVIIDEHIKNVKDDFKKLTRLYQLLGVTYRKAGVNDSARYYYEKSLNLSKKNQSKLDFFGSKFSLLGLDYETYSYMEIKANISELSQYIDTSKDGDSYSMLLNLLGDYQLKNGKHEEAIKTLLKANSIINIKRYRNKLVNFNILGLTYSAINLLDESLHYLTKGYQLSKEHNDSLFMAVLKTNIGIVYWRKGNYDVAFKDFDESYDLFLKINDFNNLAQLNYSMGRCYFDTKDKSKGLKHFKKGLDLSIEYGTAREKLLGYIIVGQAYFSSNELDSSGNYLNKGKELSEMAKVKDVYLLGQLNFYLAELNYKQKKFENAYDYLIKYQAFKDSSENLELKRKASFGLYKNEILEAKRQEEKLLDEVKEVKKLNVFLILFILAVVLMIFGFIFFRNLFIKQQIEVYHLKMKIAEEEKEFAKQNIQRLKEDMINKNLLIKELEYENQIKLDESLSTRMIENLSNEKNWARFLIDFELLFPNFISDLEKAYPKLKKNDFRLITLYKLKLTDKEIADILNVSYDSIRIMKYRLKEKINQKVIEDIL